HAAEHVRPMRDTHERWGPRMANRRDVVIDESSVVPLPVPRWVRGEDAAAERQFAKRLLVAHLLHGSKELSSARDDAARKPAAADHTERAGAAPVEEGDLPLVPDGRAETSARRERT